MRKASNPVTALTHPHVLAVLGLGQWAFHWDMLHVQVRCWFSTQQRSPAAGRSNHVDWDLKHRCDEKLPDVNASSDACKKTQPRAQVS